MKMEAVRSFGALKTNYPTTRRNNTKTCFLNKQAAETSNRCFRIVKNIFLCDCFIFLIHGAVWMHE
jgi:hypothetical protein